MTDKLLYEQDGHVVTLTFNMPETMNALTDHDLCTAIVEACHRINGDPVGALRHSSPAPARPSRRAATSST